ncbi:MAG: DNA polymerase III subunit gamma/tau [Clostridia bacterium]|nr:DNA polymerase III subunit gamma/tau [Clostridia bacterium]
MAGTVSHAYLFCGSRGTGKTSCAKILAKAVNCLHPKDGNPCNECAACLAVDRGTSTDVIEMDAASNNGVDNVRNLKDEIAFTPAELRYRVYIIDEVHMMSSSAFNALLKTLEEPPTYVVFILATTEFNKLPTTIVSRCQRFDFKRISTADIKDRLFHIAKAEGIEINDDGAGMIARAAMGGMRDAVSLLELCAGSRTLIDADLVSSVVGAGNRQHAYRMLDALSVGNFESAYDVIREVNTSGVDLSVFWADLTDAYRDLMVFKSTDRAKTYLDLTDSEFEQLRALAEKFSMPKLIYHTSLLQNALSDMQRTAGAKRAVAEIAVTRMCDPKLTLSAESLALRVEELEKQISLLKLSGVPAPAEAPTIETLPPEPQKPAAESAPKEAPTSPSFTPEPYAKFGRVVEKIGQIKPPLSVKFIKASCECNGEKSFVITMSKFFAESLADSPTDVGILRGIIAETENCPPSEIHLAIRQAEGGATVNLADEIDAAIENQ